MGSDAEALAKGLREPVSRAEQLYQQAEQGIVEPAVYYEYIKREPNREVFEDYFQYMEQWIAAYVTSGELVSKFIKSGGLSPDVSVIEEQVEFLERGAPFDHDQWKRILEILRGARRDGGFGNAEESGLDDVTAYDLIRKIFRKYCRLFKTEANEDGSHDLETMQRFVNKWNDKWKLNPEPDPDKLASRVKEEYFFVVDNLDENRTIECHAAGLSVNVEGNDSQISDGNKCDSNSNVDSVNSTISQTDDSEHAQNETGFYVSSCLDRLGIQSTAWGEWVKYAVTENPKHPLVTTMRDKQQSEDSEKQWLSSEILLILETRIRGGKIRSKSSRNAAEKWVKELRSTS